MTYLREVSYPGLAFVADEAAKRGYHPGDPDWINLGQGQPEVGPLPGAPPRIGTVSLTPEDHAYGPGNGDARLRQAVADYYNETHRRGRRPYRAANVAVVQGGRLALSRMLAALGEITIGHMLPDYWAYEAMLGRHLHTVTPVPVRVADGERMNASLLAKLVAQTGTRAFLMSNPCNPTGAVIAGDDLGAFVGQARHDGCALLVDEFYSHFTYTGDGPVSAASHVEDPDRDEVLIFDGLTKNFRYPGWRLGWVVGPADAVGVLDRVGSALDGGASRIAQRAALAVLEPDHVKRESAAVRAWFRRKRDLMVGALRDMGIRAEAPDGTFYVWGRCPGDSLEVFYRALEQRVVTVPGHLFDVNPGGRRRGGEYREWMRFSFGPPLETVQEGLVRLAKLF